LLTSLPGGLGFLIVVNVLIFVLAFFLDFFELSFIIFLWWAGCGLGIDRVGSGSNSHVNMQTSFMHPPLGSRFSSAASRREVLDRRPAEGRRQ
jgi:TRAP-type mannitol/chloroaromatic compound transport system permease large subunit